MVLFSGSVLRQTAILYHHYKIWICFLFQIAHFSVGTYYILPLLHNYVQYRQEKNKETQFNSVYELKSQWVNPPACQNKWCFLRKKIISLNFLTVIWCRNQIVLPSSPRIASQGFMKPVNLNLKCHQDCEVTRRSEKSARIVTTNHRFKTKVPVSLDKCKTGARNKAG